MCRQEIDFWLIMTSRDNCLDVFLTYMYQSYPFIPCPCGGSFTVLWSQGSPVKSRHRKEHGREGWRLVGGREPRLNAEWIVEGLGTKVEDKGTVTLIRRDLFTTPVMSDAYLWGTIFSRKTKRGGRTNSNQETTWFFFSPRGPEVSTRRLGPWPPSRTGLL